MEIANCPRLQMSNITKKYAGITALQSVNFTLNRGEVHALVGENGAGKSTLIKILGGAIPKTQGEIFFDGVKQEIHDPQQAQRLGVAVIYQELMLAPDLTAADNILLGRFPKKWKLFVDKKEVLRRSREILSMLGSQIDLNIPIHLLTIAEQQMVEVARALSLNANIIVMDEPSAVLTPHELGKLFDVIRTLKQQGVSFIYISHRLEEVFRIADRVTVLRDGAHQCTRNIRDVNRDQIITLMVGRNLTFADAAAPIGKGHQAILEVKGLRSEFLQHPIDFTLYQGEILGIAGLVGAGRTQVVRALFGADAKLAGQIFINGKTVEIHSPADAVRQGLGLVPEDRKNQGLLMDLSVAENMTITNLKKLTSAGVIKKSREKQTAESLIARLDIRTSSIADNITSLSGGNQQKVILARWLDSNAKIIIFDEPTRGVDVGAKSQIHSLMRELKAQGTSIIMISSELPEILDLSDRILVMRQGRITGQLQRELATEEKIISMATQ
ncbi:MAG: sugar ABC transporter ATP-binding protein [Candidatus Zhuqueibacterota bacterium]